MKQRLYFKELDKKSNIGYFKRKNTFYYMKIENVNVAIFHRKDTTKIQAVINSENSYNLGKKEIDDNFKIEFNSEINQNFLVFNNKDGHYEYIEDVDDVVSAEISLHKKLVLVIIKNGGIAIQYNLEIKHRDHQSLFYFLKEKDIKIFLHSNGLPDSYEIDRHRNHIFLNKIFSKMDEGQLK